MAKEICISTTPHETRLAILEDDQLSEVYYERENEYTLAGSIYKGRVTRVLPGMQSSFVDVGLERDAFLYVTDFLEEQEDSEEYDTAAPRKAAPAASEEQPSSGEERRGGRREGRGRRNDRGERNAERGTERGAERQPVPVESAPVEPVVKAVPAQTAPVDTEEDDETPQGTRRWRGRRGRRRGGMRNAALQGGESLPATAAAPFGLAEHGAPGGLELSPEPEDILDGRVDLQAVAQEETVAAPVETPRRENRREGRREKQAAPQAESQAGSSGSQSSALTLPGEAITKYGGVPEVSSAKPAAPGKAAPAVQVNYVAPRPATQVEVPAGYDGGSVLPGESLSRYRNAAKASAVTEASLNAVAPVAESNDAPAAEPVRRETLHPEPVQTQSLDEREHVEAPVAAEPVAEIPQAEPVSADLASATAEVESSHEPQAEITAPKPVAPAAEPEPEAAHPAEEPLSGHSIVPEHEYEPQEGESAGQPGPSTTSELRFSQLFGGGDRDADKSRERAENTRSTVEAGAETPAVEAAAAEHEHVLPEVHAVATHEPEAPQHSALEQANAALSPAFGERFDDVETVEEIHEEVHEEEHEHHAVAHLSGEQAKEDRFREMVDQLHGFAPGNGLVEEEVIDEDEYDFEPMHAHADEHDLEELEEETLDGDHQHGAQHAPAENDSLELRMEEAGFEEAEEADEAEGAFAFESVEEDEEGAAQPAEGEPRRREGGDRNRRNGGRNGRRRMGGSGSGGRRQSAQTQDMPIISDLLKAGQEILVQIAKEPIAKKGARITSHIALPGRFLVFMPTVGHVGVSRKIASDEERQRLKRILISEKGDSSGGFIVRTAAEGASEEELRADLRFLINLWSEIKQRADTAKAPALIYHDLNLVERILRDQVSSNFSTIWVDTEQEYERIVRFLNRFQPSLVRRVKLYTKETPLFDHFGIQEEISKALKSKVWLKSGGSIVINQTEALVAIDINTGKYVGKTARLEDTIVKTNLDAIPEIVRQIRLRDLGGIIVIDFIDMDERKNRQKVLAALEEELKADRAPSKVLQFNDFGLVAITRKRVKQSLERTLSVQCNVCSGTGMVKSPITVCNEIYIELRKMQKHLDGKDVMLRVHPEVVKLLKSGNAKWINEYEELVGKTIIIKSDPALHPEQFDIH